MRSFLPLIVLLSTFALAQESPTRGPATGDASANSTTPKSYQGCVIRSNGSIMLTDSSNQDYKLVSAARKLDGYVGKEVKITASRMNAVDPSSDEHNVEAHQPKSEPKTLDVADIQKVADMCSSPQKPGQQPSAR
jgi:hypothetical protein